MTLARVALFCMMSFPGFAAARIIGGDLVNAEDYPEVVQLDFDGAHCSGTVVGPRLVMTAAHCLGDGGKVTVIAGKKEFEGQAFRSELYPSTDHDVALVVTKKNLKIAPVFLGAEINTKAVLTVVGYGCTQAGGGGGFGELFAGEAMPISVGAREMVSKGAALCFGDSGGPAFQMSGEDRVLVGIGSKGNITDTNYHMLTFTEEDFTFYDQVIAETGVELCGYNSDCE